MKTLASIVNSVYSGGWSSLAGGIGLGASVFGALWTLGGALGVDGSLQTFVFLVAASAFAPLFLWLFRPVRWALIAWLVQRELPAVRNFSPSLLVGVGPGGAIIAGMLAKLLARTTDREPIVAIIDRTFNWVDGRNLEVILEEVGRFDADVGKRFPKVLLVTSEIHTGNTMQAAHQRLRELEVEVKSFSICANPNSSFRADYAVVRSDKTGILPWSDSPDRIHGAPN